jgi:hypothetical protein
MELAPKLEITLKLSLAGKQLNQKELSHAAGLNPELTVASQG